MGVGGTQAGTSLVVRMMSNCFASQGPENRTENKNVVLLPSDMGTSHIRT